MPTDTGTDSNRCPQCGRTFPANVRLCPNDGTVLDEQTPPGSKYLGMVLDGKYRLDSYLSKGGMGSVYKATHVMLNRTVAVKLINAEIVSSPEVVRRFQREARAATTLNHPNITGVFDLGQTADGTLYIAMEFIDGPSLKSVLSKEGPMAPPRIVSIMWQISAALAVAHKRSIIHRDLKPHNIMIARDDKGREIAKLVDFGIAKTFDEATQLTQTGFVVGTPQYMAPEQAEGRPVDARSDIYSLGVILYEMLSGEVPFNDPSTPMILIKHIKETPVLPSLKNPDAHVSPELEGIAMRCLQKDPAARFQTAEEFGNALNAVPLGPGGEVLKKDPAAAAAWDFTTLVTPGAPTVPLQSAPTVMDRTAPTVMDRTVPTPSAGATAPTLVVAPTAATIPMQTPQQKTRIGTTAPSAPPAPTVAATVAATVPSTVASTAAAPTSAAAPMSTMSAPPVIAPPQPVTAPPVAEPSPTRASAPASSSSSKTPLLVAAAVIVILLAAAAWFRFGRSSATSPAVATTTASAPPAAANPAPPPTTAAPPPSNPPAQTAGATPSSTSAAPTDKPAAPAATSSAAPRGASSAKPVASAPAAPARTAPAPAIAAPTQAPAQPATPPVAAFPANPSVAFRCTGANDVCGAFRSAVDEALQKAGLRSLRDAARADIAVEASVTPVEDRVSNQFGTTFAVRTYSIEVSGEAPRTGDNVAMPSSTTLSYDPKFGAERVTEKARLIADGIVEKVRAFAAKAR